MIREINSSDWPAFCQRVSQQRAGATVKLEVIEPNGVKTERIAGATLQSITFDATGPCNNVITLRLGNARETAYEVLDPIKLLLNPSGAPGDFNPLEIEAENGVTFITFQPAIHLNMLEGLKTA